MENHLPKTPFETGTGKSRMEIRRVAFLVSGGGGNLRFLHRCSVDGIVPGLEVCSVIADRECHALEYARAQGIPSRQLDYDRRSPESLRLGLQECRADAIITNVHKIIDPGTVRLFAGKLINLHYSLLPDFGGSIGEKPVRQALDAGRTEVGTTLHFVDESLDGGPIISQTRLGVKPGEPFETLMDRVFRSGCLNLVNGLQLLFRNGSPSLAETDFDEGFWAKIRH